MEGVIAILAVFGTPVLIVFLSKYYKLKEKQLAFEAREAPRQLAAVNAERKQLEARIQNLESIVCSVDFELNQRLNRLATEASQAAHALPAVPVSAATTAATTSAATATAARAAPRGFGLLEVGQVVLGRYTVEREIGRGGMGAVYLARDAMLCERVALKTISSLLAGDPEEQADRFTREVQAARKVTHGNVIRIHDLGEDGPLLFLSMEYIDGETLAARVGRVGPLPIAEACEILGAIADGVAAAHAVGVVHRDLKPHNVLLGKAGAAREVKVIDFGLAQTAFRISMTATGMILGTPEYMAPEQIRGRRSDARTDVYALGALAYFVVCGRAPFVGDNAIAIGFAQVNDPPQPPRELRPELPRPLESAILRALAKDPAERFPDAAAFRQALSTS